MLRFKKRTKSVEPTFNQKVITAFREELSLMFPHYYPGDFWENTMDKFIWEIFRNEIFWSENVIRSEIKNKVVSEFQTLVSQKTFKDVVAWNIERFDFKKLIDDMCRDYIANNREEFMPIAKKKLEAIKIKDEILYDSIIKRLVW